MVRLISIDAPESRVTPKPKKDAARNIEDLNTIIAMGMEATRFVQKLGKRGDRVSLEFDVEERDRYGRLLSWVFLPDGRIVNEEIGSMQNLPKKFGPDPGRTWAVYVA